MVVFLSRSDLMYYKRQSLCSPRTKVVMFSVLRMFSESFFDVRRAKYTLSGCFRWKYRYGFIMLKCEKEDSQNVPSSILLPLFGLRTSLLSSDRKGGHILLGASV